MSASHFWTRLRMVSFGFFPSSIHSSSLKTCSSALLDGWTARRDSCVGEDGSLTAAFSRACTAAESIRRWWMRAPSKVCVMNLAKTYCAVSSSANVPNTFEKFPSDGTSPGSSKPHRRLRTGRAASSPMSGLMGVPKSFLDKYNPDQFEIIGNASDTDWCREAGIAPRGQAAIDQLRKQGNMAHVTANMNSLYLVQDGKVVLPYARIIIRRRVK